MPSLHTSQTLTVPPRRPTLTSASNHILSHITILPSYSSHIYNPCHSPVSTPTSVPMTGPLVFIYPCNCTKPKILNDSAFSGFSTFFSSFFLSSSSPVSLSAQILYFSHSLIPALLLDAPPWPVRFELFLSSIFSFPAVIASESNLYPIQGSCLQISDW
ncbi:hypothetical protein SLE2022_072280 [Rubroshorea leprosula]